MNISESYKQCVTEELQSQLKRLGMADNQIAITIKTVCNAGFIQRLVNLSEIPSEDSGEIVEHKPSEGGLRGSIKSIKMEPGKKDLQIVMDLASTKETRASVANMTSAIVDIYPVEVEPEEDAQMDVEDYVKGMEPENK